MSSFKCILKFLTVFVLICAKCSAAIVVTFGNGGTIDLLPNAAGQVVEFSVSGGDLFDGLELDLQVGDGGVDIGGVLTGPSMTAIDLTTNTIFSANGPNQANVVAFPLARQSTVDTATAVLANGIIGRVTFDTTGIGLGNFDLLLTGVAGAFDTTFFNGANALAATVPNGTIRVVPEPSSMAIIIAASAGLVFRRYRKCLASGEGTESQ
jgi:hypothetical protein